jgi:hypothetical protein
MISYLMAACYARITKASDPAKKLSLFTLVAGHNGLDNFNFLQLPLKVEQVFPDALQLVD